jgi:hypothetical protein
MLDPGMESTSLKRPEGATAGGLVGTFALVWGVGGFSALLLFAVLRLAPLALESTAYSWTLWQGAIFVLNLVFMAWVEGYRGFQLNYSPRLAARAHYLYHHATPAQAVLAPLVCMGFVYATRRRLITAWLLTAGIVAIVLVYRSLPQPWRGILDAGVVVGLAWGVAATLHCVVKTLRHGPRVDHEVRAG